MFHQTGEYPVGGPREAAPPTHTRVPATFHCDRLMNPEARRALNEPNFSFRWT
jgi:hypothetical protein